MTSQLLGELARVFATEARATHNDDQYFHLTGIAVELHDKMRAKKKEELNQMKWMWP